MEYYKLCKLDKTISLKKQNPFVFKHPFRLLVINTFESEKISIVIHLLLRSKYLKIYSWMFSKKRSYKISKGRSKNFNERYISYDNLIIT